MAGVLFSLLLLILLPGQIVVNYDVDGLPSDIGSKWVLVSVFLFFQGILCLFFSIAPSFISHAYRAEVWQESKYPLVTKWFLWFLPSVLRNERKMRELREAVLGLFWFFGSVSMFYIIGFQWYIAANNGVLPALPKDVGEMMLLIGFLVFFMGACITIIIIILKFLIPIKKMDTHLADQETEVLHEKTMIPIDSRIT